MSQSDKLSRPLPMLAQPVPMNFSPTKEMYVAEEKFDGHRIIVDTRRTNIVDAWSRTGKSCTQKLHPAMIEELNKLPKALLDAELIMPGGRSYDVTVLENHHKLELVIFDVLALATDVGGQPLDISDTTSEPLFMRRKLLEMIFVHHEGFRYLRLAQQWAFSSVSALNTLVETIWARSGEGVIVKDLHARYEPGKRKKHFMKIKECETAVLKVIGFAPSEGEIRNRGAAGITVLQDEEGNRTVVKTLDDATCDRLAKRFKVFSEPEQWERAQIAGKWVDYRTDHQDVGRELRIEYHQRTPDMSYRHARWDRWEDE